MTSQIQKIKNRAFGETKLQTSWNQLYLCSGLRLNQAQNLSNWFNNSQTAHRLTTHQRNRSKFVLQTRQKSRQISRFRRDRYQSETERMVGGSRNGQGSHWLGSAKYFRPFRTVSFTVLHLLIVSSIINCNFEWFYTYEEKLFNLLTVLKITWYSKQHVISRDIHLSRGLTYFWINSFYVILYFKLLMSKNRKCSNKIHFVCKSDR